VALALSDEVSLRIGITDTCEAIAEPSRALRSGAGGSGTSGHNDGGGGDGDTDGDGDGNGDGDGGAADVVVESLVHVEEVVAPPGGWGMLASQNHTTVLEAH
jgi:hypothetical protein